MDSTMATATATPPATKRFFTDDFRNLVSPPNGGYWFHNMPLPDGDRIAGANPDRAREQKLWRSTVDALGLDLRGKRVLDIGANDGIFTIASLLRGADHVTAINPGDMYMGTYPHNLKSACEWWDVQPEVMTGDFVTAPLPNGSYDIILFYGVLYHLKNVFAAFQKLRDLLAPGGVVLMETQVTTVVHPRPIFELASDLMPTTVPQFKALVGSCGSSNFLMPNDAALMCLADTYGLQLEFPNPRTNEYEQSPGLSTRRIGFLRAKS